MATTCTPLETIFLGTGTSTGIPIVSCNCEVCMSSNDKDKRLRCSILIKSTHTTILIDAGMDVRMQLLKYQVKSIDAVLLTHGHKDHIGGIDDLRPFTFLHHHRIPIYANKATLEAVFQEVPYMFDKKYKYEAAAEFDLHEISEHSQFAINDISVSPIGVQHADLSILGYRFGDFTYITDCKTIDDKEKDKIRHSKILVLNAVRKKPHYSHLNLDEAIALSAELQAEETYLTHIGHQLGHHVEVEQELPHNVHLAYDGLHLRI